MIADPKNNTYIPISGMPIDLWSGVVAYVMGKYPDPQWNYTHWGRKNEVENIAGVYVTSEDALYLKLSLGL